MANRDPAGSGLLLGTDFPGPGDADHLLTFNAAGTRLAVGCDAADYALVFDPHSGREVARLPDLRHLTSMSFLSAEVLLTVQQPHMGKTKFLPGRCCRHDLRRGGREVLWEEPTLRCVAAGPDGRTVAFGVGSGLALFDARTQKLLRRGESELCQYPERAAFSEGGRFVAIGLCGPSPESSPRVAFVWDAADGRRYRTFEIRADYLSALAFRGDTLGLAVAAWRGVFLFEPGRGEEPAASYHPESQASALQFRDRGRLAVLRADGGQVFLQTSTGRVLREVPPPAGRVLGYATPTPDWSLFAAAAEGGVFVWPAGEG